ncbi:MAG: hypothetical protein FJX40_00295 [Alphaproteobacteria bacterium]|nr:hypothetical protein [Alphaproteobacteria bacterium]MBM3641232.1 hypothetical protein [Alphaproteobacteria bacterium]
MATDYQTLDRLLEQLEALFHAAERGDASWRDVWGLKKQIHEFFRDVRYPTPQDRVTAWERFREIVDEMKEQKEEADRHREERARESDKCLKRIKTLADNVMNYDPTGAEVFINVLGLGLIPNLAAVATTGHDPFFSTQLEILQARSSLMREAWADFQENKDILMRNDRAAAHDALQEAQEDLNNDWRDYKEKKQRHYEEKRTQWRERIEKNIEKEIASVSRMKEALENKKDFRARCVERRATARSDSFRDEMQAKIDAVDDEIYDVEEAIQKHEGYIEDFRKKLDE